jgi:hypothetical protein
VEEETINNIVEAGVETLVSSIDVDFSMNAITDEEYALLYEFVIPIQNFWKEQNDYFDVPTLDVTSLNKRIKKIPTLSECVSFPATVSGSPVTVQYDSGCLGKVALMSLSFAQAQNLSIRRRSVPLKAQGFGGNLDLHDIVYAKFKAKDLEILLQFHIVPPQMMLHDVLIGPFIGTIYGIYIGGLPTEFPSNSRSLEPFLMNGPTTDINQGSGPNVNTEDVLCDMAIESNVTCQWFGTNFADLMSNKSSFHEQQIVDQSTHEHYNGVHCKSRVTQEHEESGSIHVSGSHLNVGSDVDRSLQTDHGKSKV